MGGPSSQLPHRNENWFVEEASPPLLPQVCAEYRNEGMEKAQGQTDTQKHPDGHGGPQLPLLGIP